MFHSDCKSSFQRTVYQVSPPLIGVQVVGGEAGVEFEVGVEDLDADKAAVHISVDIQLRAFKDELPSNNAPAFIPWL